MITVGAALGTTGSKTMKFPSKASAKAFVYGRLLTILDGHCFLNSARHGGNESAARSNSTSISATAASTAEKLQGTELRFKRLCFLEA